ncbi:hypothetical protein ES708_32246 [subsurface metagenome]
MKGDAPHELDVEVALADGAPSGFADGGKGFGQQLVQGSAFLNPSLELVGLGAQLTIGKFLEFGLKLVDAIYYGLQAL